MNARRKARFFIVITKIQHGCKIYFTEKEHAFVVSTFHATIIGVEHK